LHIVFSAVQGGGGRGAIDGEQERDFGEGVHIKPWRCSSPAVHRWDIAPPSLGVSPGTVFNLWKTPPPPGRSRVTENPFCRNTPTSRRVPRLRPPPSEGAGSAWRLARWPCHGGKQDLRGVSRLKSGEGNLSRGAVSTGYRLRGGGADGEGDGTSPSPVSCISD